jgi:hypothetical protein
MVVSTRTKAITTASANTWHNSSTPTPYLPPNLH